MKNVQQELVNVIAENNRLLNMVLATGRIPSETKKALTAQKRQNRETILEYNTICPVCKVRPPDKKRGVCEECSR